MGRLPPYRDVRRGDIIVFYKPTEEQDGEHLILVKRVIGVPATVFASATASCI